MNNQHNPYAELYAHIKAFECPAKDDDWDDFIARIKQQILLKQIAFARRICKEQSPCD